MHGFLVIVHVSLTFRVKTEHQPEHRVTTNILTHHESEPHSTPSTHVPTIHDEATRNSAVCSFGQHALTSQNPVRGEGGAEVHSES